jgi:AdoMet-dependent heme synthase
MKEERAGSRLADLDFERSPFLVIWETTRACDLACRHCRAEAIPERDPGELTTSEAAALMEEVRRFGRPLFVLTGGDPLKRPDTVELVRHGAGLGLRMGMTPSGTPLMTPIGVPSPRRGHETVHAVCPRRTARSR